MLRLYPVILDWLESLAPVIRAIRLHDAGLADQLRRSSTAVCLNVAEGGGAVGGDKRRSYRIALREMREAAAAIDIATRSGLATAPEADAADRQSRIVGTLVKLAQPQR